MTKEASALRQLGGTLLAALIGAAIAFVLSFVFLGFRSPVAIAGSAAIAAVFYQYWPITFRRWYILPAIVIGMIVLAFFLISPTYIGRLL